MARLLELAGDVRNLMEQMSDLDAAQKNVQALKTRARMFGNLREKAEKLDKARKLLRTAGVPLDLPLKASKQLVSRSQHVREKFQEDWEATLFDTKLNDTFIGPANEHWNKTEAELKKAWRAHVDQKGPQIRSDWLAHLPDAVFGEAKQKLQRIQDELIQLRQNLPEDGAAASRPVRLNEEVAPIFSQVENLPEPVRAFLDRATHKGARLEDLTDDVRQWLEKNSMLDQVRIHIG